MRKLVFLLLFLYINIISFSFYGYAYYDDDVVDCEDWYEYEYIEDGDYWAIELLSDDDIDYIYDIIISSEVKVDFLFVDYDGLEDYKAGSNFEYDSDESSLDHKDLDCDITLEKNDDSIYILIDNSNKVDGGACCGCDSEVNAWISPRKQMLYTTDEIFSILTISFLIAMVCGISVAFLIIIQNKQKNKKILENIFSHSTNQQQPLIQQLENARMREEKEPIFLKLSQLTGDSVEDVKKSYYQTKFLLTPISSEKIGLILLILSIVLCYLGAFYYSIIKTTHYVEFQEFDDYLFTWPGLVLLCIGTLLFIVGCYALEDGWIGCSEREICRKRMNYFFIGFVITLFIMMAYAFYIRNVLWGPWGGYLYPWIAIILAIYCRARVIKVLKSKPHHEGITIYSNVQDHFPQQSTLNSSTQSLFPPSAYQPSTSTPYIQQSFIYCSYCGKRNSINNNFCVNCGEKIQQHYQE